KAGIFFRFFCFLHCMQPFSYKQCLIIKHTSKMKKIILMLLPALLLLGSCQKTYLVPNKTIIVDLPSRNWTLANDARSYTSYIDMPELDRYTNEQGAVLVYLSFGEETYEQIPQ